MPQPGASEVQAKLRARYGNKAGSTRTGGGKNAMRRKKFRQKKSTNEFEKRLQANLKKLSCNTIPGIEEVNLFKSDGTVIHFISPKVDAEVSSNTFIVSGNYTHNKIEELLPDILPQIGSDHLTQLKDYAEKFEALKPNNDEDQDTNAALSGGGITGIGGDDGDVPMLIDEDLNFETIAQSDEKKQEQSEITEETEVVNDATENETNTDNNDNKKDDDNNDAPKTDDAANDESKKDDKPKEEEEEEEAPKEEENTVNTEDKPDDATKATEETASTQPNTEETS